VGIEELYQQGRRAAVWGLTVSLGLGAAKLAGGLMGGSVALVSDAAHSLVDAVISTVLLFALKIAQRPADPEHPYGHGRVESLAGQAVATVLIVLAIGIAWTAIKGLSRPYVAPEAFTLVIAAGGAVLQELLYRSTSRVARESGSAALLATAWDYRLDALGSVAVLFGVAAARWGGPAWHWADHAAAIVVASTIFWVGAGLLWENMQALEVPGVRDVETLRVRKAGLEYLVDIHVEVDPHLTVREGHVIAHRVKARLIGELRSVRDVLVHIEPADEN
jgi:cation diffusion facilitator family transporter